MKKTNSLRHGVVALAIAGSVGVFAFAPTAPAFAHNDHGDRKTETREVSTFTRIQVKGGIELDLTAGKDQKVTIEAYEGDMRDIKTYVRGDTLVIDLDDDDDDNNMSFHSEDVNVTISMKMLEELEVLGAVDADLRGIDSKELTIDIKGAADLEAEGTCGSLRLEIKGAGDVDTEELRCEDVEVSVRGVGEAKVFASESVDANVSGIGSITVYGEPKRVRQSDGFLGSIRIK
ncbi:head GIN domain-containing protein [Kordiimonas aestuarii]|uniref:head GIN domain-containing protein n=1 Tax=Kordiimonas aestuarii TaxID=1005925 RepID=UPI0021D2FA17|nr:head GIN domain-containing protein [Kordiimonas aestuarii]